MVVRHRPLWLPLALMSGRWQIGWRERADNPWLSMAKDVVLRPQGALRHQVADGGIVSTLHDQVRFMSALVTGEVFTSADTWPRMHRSSPISLIGATYHSPLSRNGTTSAQS